MLLSLAVSANSLGSLCCEAADKLRMQLCFLMCWHEPLLCCPPKHVSVKPFPFCALSVPQLCARTLLVGTKTGSATATAAAAQIWWWVPQESVQAFKAYSEQMTEGGVRAWFVTDVQQTVRKESDVAPFLPCTSPFWP